MATYNDGTIPSGSNPATVTINSVSYIANNWRFSEPSSVLERLDADNVPNAAKYSSQRVTGTAELQLATTGTALPDLFEEFTISYRGASVVFVVTEVNPGSANNEISNVSIGFAKVINP
jgi:hypothetical protein